MTSMWTVAFVAAFAQLPGGSCPNCQAGQAAYGAPAYGGGQVYAGGQAYGGPVYGGGYDGYGAAYGGGVGYTGNASGNGTGPVSYSGSPSAVGGPVGPGSGGYDLLYPYDDARPWVHGYWQEIPSYGGYHKFRPYNYHHVLSQSQVAAGWGMSPTLGYTQEVFRRYPPLNPTTTYNRRFNPAHSDEEIYRAELAKLRAQRDFGRSQPRESSREVQAQPTSGPVLKAPVVSTAVHTQTRNPQAEQLGAKLREQQRQLQQLQEELDRAQR